MAKSGLIASLDDRRREVPRGLEHPLNRFSGAWAARIIEGENSHVPEHSHDWPVLSLYVLGQCARSSGFDEVHMDGPSAVLQAASEAHTSRMGDTGLEQIDIQFDPSWLRLPASCGVDRMYFWKGGEVGARARRLARLWAHPGSGEALLLNATRSFLSDAFQSRPVSGPSWLTAVQKRLASATDWRVTELARELGLHPSWLGQVYRAHCGESLGAARTRKRVEMATRLLRTSGDSAAEIAVAAGFYDQSHMIRCFKTVLGRAPSEVRREGAELRKGSTGAAA